MGFTISAAAEEAPKKGGFTIAPPEPEGGVNWQAVGDTVKDTAKNIGMGALKGAADIGATALAPLDYLKDKITGAADPTLGTLVTGQKPKTSNEQRREQMGQFFKENADPSSVAFKGGELASDIAGTAGVGGAIAKGVRAIPVVSQFAPKLAAAIESGGFSLGGAPATTTAGKLANAATRVSGGAITGGASAGLLDPASATTGGAIGAALPGAVKAAGMAGKALAPEISSDVAALYQKAKSLGIDVPADRIVNSRPLNAAAASLNYIPLSGRSGTEEKMVSQLNRALSRTFGQDSDNVTAALRKAATNLGDKFEVTLKSNTVKADNQLLDDLVTHVDKASKELGADGAKIIGNQVDEILNKVGANGEIDGQAAYNIKKTLDRIGNRNSPEAFYARDLKKSLMGALDRSLGPQEAAAFAKTRKQYGNMLDLENLAQNGAEGGISIGRLANLKNINNKELQDLADISAQFVKTRESPHGAMQRVAMGGVRIGAAGAGLGAAGFAPAAIPAIAGGVAAGRVANTVLNSNALKSLLLNQGAASGNVKAAVGSPAFRALMYDSANQANP